jgi:hypothetical protein
MLRLDYAPLLRSRLDAYATLLSQCVDDDEDFALSLLAHLTTTLEDYAADIQKMKLPWLAAKLTGLAEGAEKV